MKSKLQQELKEKIREGIKPSDLKKLKEKNNSSNYSSPGGIPTPPPTPPFKPQKEDHTPPPISIDPVPELKNQLEQLEQNNQRLLAKIQELEQPLNPTIELWKKRYFDLEKQTNERWKELDQTIFRLKEKLRKKHQENKELIEKYSNLENPTKNKEQVKENKLKSFYCDGCQLNKSGDYIIRKVDAPFEPRLHGRTCYLCLACAPYVKELNDTTFATETNPYQIE